MSRRRLRIRPVERARLNAAASALGHLLGWRRNQADAFVQVLAASSWRHCRQAESQQIVAKCTVAYGGGAGISPGDAGGIRAGQP